MPAEKNPSPTGKSSSVKSTPLGKHPAVFFFSVAVLLLIAVTFVIGPAGFQIGLNREQGDFGAYRGERIVYREDNYFGIQQANLAEQYRDAGVEASIQVIYQIWRTAFQQTLFRTALLQRAEASGYDVTSSMIDDVVASNSRFYVDGEFSVAAYRAIPQSELLQMRDSVRENIISTKMIDDILLGNFLSDAETDFIVSIGNDRITCNYVYLDDEFFPNTEIVSYIDQNPTLFRAADISRLTMSDLEEINAVRQQILGGEISFEEAATANSIDLYSTEGGQRGLTFAYDLLAETGADVSVDRILNTEVSALTEAIALITGGFSIYRLNTDVRQADTGNPEEISAIRSYVMSREPELVSGYLESAAEELSLAAQARGFAEAAEAAGYEMSSTTEFPINVGNVGIFSPVRKDDGTVIDNAEYSEDFYRAAFSLEDGETSDPVELANGYIVLNLASRGTMPDFEREYIETTSLSSALEDWTSVEIERSVLKPEYIEDNFDEMFFTYIYQP